MFMGYGKSNSSKARAYLYYVVMKHRESGRHLAVILFTDIVGYTSMMQRDEAIALHAVRHYQQVLERLVPAYEGEIYQFYGDGSMSIFTSAIQAVSCALALQLELRQEPIVPLKVGMHIGEIYNEGGKIKTKTNHSGGVQGGISNGEDIYFNVAFKPVATIMQDQQSVDKEGNEVTVSGKGRHDPCVVPRAVPIVESMAALVMADFLLRSRVSKL